MSLMKVVVANCPFGGGSSFFYSIGAWIPVAQDSGVSYDAVYLPAPLEDYPGVSGSGGRTLSYVSPQLPQCIIPIYQEICMSTRAMFFLSSLIALSQCFRKSSS